MVISILIASVSIFRNSSVGIDDEVILVCVNYTATRGNFVSSMLARTINAIFTVDNVSHPFESGLSDRPRSLLSSTTVLVSSGSDARIDSNNRSVLG